jgi:hypothetical protein
MRIGQVQRDRRARPAYSPADLFFIGNPFGGSGIEYRLASYRVSDAIARHVATRLRRSVLHP